MALSPSQWVQPLPSFILDLDMATILAVSPSVVKTKKWEVDHANFWNNMVMLTWYATLKKQPRPNSRVRAADY